MPLTPIEKNNILIFLKNHGVEDIYVGDLLDCINHDNKKIVAVLEFLIDNLLKSLNNGKPITDKKIYKLLVCIYNYFYYIATEKKCPLTEEFISKLKSIDESYQNYLKETNQKENEDIKEQINRFADFTFKEVKKEKEELSEDDKFSLIETIKDLQQTLEEKKKELTVTKRKATRLENNLAKKQAIYDCLDENYKQCKAELKEAKKRIVQLEKELTKVQKIMEKEKSLNDSYEVTTTNITNEKKELLEEIKLLKEELELKDSQLITLNKKINSIENKIIKNQTIETNILKILGKISCTKEEIITYLKGKKISITDQELNESLNSINKKINIINNSTIELPPRYLIQPPKVKTNQNFQVNLTDNQNSYDFILLSDLHILEDNIEDLEKLNCLFDYGTAKNVKLYITAGDIFDFQRKMKSTLNDINHVEYIVEKIAELYPKDKDVYHAIMGGNHERNALPTGIDPIKTMSELRSDIIDIGYDNAIVNFKDKESSNIVLHHANRKVSIPPIYEKYDNQSLKNYLDNYYTANNIDRNNTYIDVFGHFHRARIDNIEGYAFINSLTRDFYQDGAWHVKVYFDNKNHIDYMIFVLLNFKNNVIKPVSDYTYKKVINHK